MGGGLQHHQAWWHAGEGDKVLHRSEKLSSILACRNAFHLALKVSTLLNITKEWEVWQDSHFSNMEGGAEFCCGKC